MRLPYLSTSVVDRRERVGVHAADEVGHGGLLIWPSTTQLRFSFWKSTNAWLPRSSPMPSSTTRTEVERPARLAQHVGDLALEQLVTARELQEEPLGREGRPQPPRPSPFGWRGPVSSQQRHDAVHAVLLAGVYVHAEQRDGQRAAHGHGGLARDALEPLVVDRADRTVCPSR